jgi:predicted SnoaL-like aldol condensation-catalyzing enzyme
MRIVHAEQAVKPVLPKVAIVRVKEAEDLAKVVTEVFVKVRGITRTMTLIAFRLYSNYVLEHMFQRGFKG